MAKHSHLPLKRLEGELTRRKPPGFGGNPQRNRGEHGPKLAQEVEAVLEEFKAAPSIEGVDPSLILRIEVAGFVDEGEWAKMGLVVLSEDQNKTLLLFATDKELQQFRKRLASYQGPIPAGQIGPAYAGLIEAIESVGIAKAEDRIGSSLSSLGIEKPSDFKKETDYLLDIELFHPGEHEQANIFVYRLENALKAHGGTIHNTYLGKNLLLCRVEASGEALLAALDLPEVAIVEAPPKPDLSFDDIEDASVEDTPAGAPPAPDAVVIAIIDSGINSGHPLLAYTMKSSFIAMNGWVDADEQGHGTSVASVAAYGDVSGRLQEANFDAPFLMSSARVVDEKGEFPTDVTVPDLMEKAIRHLHEDSGCRIFNISLGDPNLIYDGGKAGSWAGTLDELASELDVLIIVSTGNQKGLAGLGEDILKHYPGYLLEPSSRLLDPSTAANVLTVGSLAHTNGIVEEDADYVGVLPVCEADEPSPFTRSGPGIRGMIKPDLVDYGGTSVWDGPTMKLVGGGTKKSAGIWTFHHKPVDRLFCARSGTSFAAPIVAHKAAILLEQFPDAPANFLRAMLALSARVPAAAESILCALSPRAPLDVCGNGVANIDEAIASDDNRVAFFTNDEIGLDRFAVYEVPIPKLFQTTKGSREISVALAFDPPVRRTRADYLGVTMGWRLIRGASEQDVFDKFRVWEKAEGDPPPFPKRNECKTFPGSQIREKGTLQRGSFTAKTDMSTYGDRYFLAVWCRRRWAPKEVKTQRFSVAVELRHSADIELYQAITVPVPLKVTL
ncbi:S8 family peptidase [Novosphingobium sp. ERN07]|uniref:S8 family peptidase n=1 Tax=Novosphingobium sp. ERN07 TaxID=2726187 RepID=UPI001456DD1A|nr:S8 family peptidase [Novosphingobium sp. ERN07]NLR73494.1 S8 family peptidase [Novosphingobium sp. ERN07]